MEPPAGAAGSGAAGPAGPDPGRLGPAAGTITAIHAGFRVGLLAASGRTGRILAGLFAASRPGFFARLLAGFVVGPCAGRAGLTGGLLAGFVVGSCAGRAGS